jgi:hypothetical protein
MKFAQDEWVVCRMFHKTTGIKKTIAPAYHVSMASAEIDQNQNNILAMPIPMPLQLQLPVPMPMQFPIMLDFTQPQHRCGDAANDATYGRYRWHWWALDQ